MNLNAHLFKADRLARLGAMLSKGCRVILAREAEAKPAALLIAAPITARVVKCELNGDETESAFIQYLSRLGNAYPREI